LNGCTCFSWNELNITEYLMVMKIHTVVFWIMMPCSINPYTNLNMMV
jgi:hypothetical protein